MSETDGKKEVKHKFALWVKDSSMELVESQYKLDDCKSRSELQNQQNDFQSSG